MCDRWDLGGISYPINHQTKETTVFIYEGIVGGIGLTKKGFEIFADLVKMTYELIRDCKCKNKDGCPSCTLSPKCGNENQMLDKESAELILKEILGLKK